MSAEEEVVQRVGDMEYSKSAQLNYGGGKHLLVDATLVCNDVNAVVSLAP